MGSKRVRWVIAVLTTAVLTMLIAWRRTQPALLVSAQSEPAVLSSAASSAGRHSRSLLGTPGSDPQRVAAQDIATLQEVDAAEHARMRKDRRLYQKLRDRAQRTSLHEQMLEHLRESARYPRSNRRFEDPELDPVLTARRAEHRTTKSADGRTLLSVWAGQSRYSVGDSLDVYASVLERPDDPESAPEPAALPLTGSLAVEDGEPLTQLQFVTTDEPGVWRATIDSRQVGGNALSAGAYRVNVDAAGELHQRLVLALQERSLSLTGSFRDSVQRGDLIVEAEVLIDREGTYYARASLYADDRTPVGFTETTLALERGLQWIPLRFHGRMLHDAGVDGPYTLAHLSVARRAFPVMHDVEADPGYMTGAHALAQLTSMPYNDLEGGE